MPEADPTPILMRRPAQVTDVWERQGKIINLSRDAFDQNSDGWLWPGPTTEAERTLFWSVVQAARCVLFEHMNNAVLGLAWIDGMPVVVYDAEEIRTIMATKRAVSKSQDLAHAENKDDTQLQSMLLQSWGARTPVFRTV